jgi:uncharacterized lipoprotein
MKAILLMLLALFLLANCDTIQPTNDPTSDPTSPEYINLAALETPDFLQQVKDAMAAATSGTSIVSVLMDLDEPEVSIDDTTATA